MRARLHTLAMLLTLMPTLALTLFLAGQVCAQASPKVIVEYAGSSVQLADVAVVSDGVIGIPLRQLAEALGGAVQWIEGTREAVFTAYRTVAIFSVASGKVTVNGTTHQLSSGFVSRDGKLAVALADLANLGLSYSVEADASAIKVFRKRATVSVSVGTVQGRPKLVISGDRELNYTAFTLKSPDRVVIDVYDAVITADVAPIAVGTGGVARVRAAMNRPGVVRVVADLDTPTGYSISTVLADAEGKARIEALFNSRVTGVSLDETSAIPRLLIAASSPVTLAVLEGPEPGRVAVEVRDANLAAGVAGTTLKGRSVSLLQALQADQGTVRLEISREAGMKCIVRALSDDGTSWAVDFAHQVTASSMREEPGSVVVEISCSGQVKPSVLRLKQPDRIALDFAGVWAAAPMEVKPTTGPGGTGLRFAQFSADTARAVIDLPGDMAYTVENPGPHIVRVRLVTSPLLGKKIVLDPGHGGTDPGAVRDKVYEKDINLDVAKRLKTLLAAAGADVVMTRDSDKSVDLQSRTDMANNSGAEAFVSIHCNSSFDVFPGGTESFYFNLAPFSQELAVLVHTYMVRSLGLLDRKVHSRDLFVLRNTAMPAALVEVAFLSNDYEFRKLGEAAFLQQAAEGIYKGLEAYFRSDVYKRWAPAGAVAPAATVPVTAPATATAPAAAAPVPPAAPSAEAPVNPPAEPPVNPPSESPPEPSAATTSGAPAPGELGDVPPAAAPPAESPAAPGLVVPPTPAGAEAAPSPAEAGSSTSKS